jgi:hypothetical protein
MLATHHMRDDFVLGISKIRIAKVLLKDLLSFYHSGADCIDLLPEESRFPESLQCD